MICDTLHFARGKPPGGDEGTVMLIRNICPRCGHATEAYKNPLPTVDVIIDIDSRVVLIKRKNDPPGWAIPGGFIDYGESAEDAGEWVSVVQLSPKTNPILPMIGFLPCLLLVF